MIYKIFRFVLIFNQTIKITCGFKICDKMMTQIMLQNTLKNIDIEKYFDFKMVQFFYKIFY